MIRKGLFLYSPALVLTITWLITLFLYFINPFNLEEIRAYTWFVMLSGLACIYLGFFTAKLLADRFVLEPTVFSTETYPFDVDKLRTLLIILTILSFIGVVVKMYMFVQQVPSLDMFLTNSREVRKIFIRVESGEGINVPLYKFFSHMASLGGLSIIIAGTLSNIKKNTIITIMPLFVSAIYSVMTLQRVYFIKHYVLWLASAFLFVYFFPRAMQKLAFKKFLKKIFFAVFIAGFFLLFVLIIRALFDLGVTTDKVINSFYFYIAGNVFLLDKYLMIDQSYFLGTSLFRSFAAWFVGFGLVEEGALIAPHYEFYKIYNTFGNTFSYIRIPYEDFGIIGVIIVSYIWGWVGYYSTRILLKQFSFLKLGFSAMVLLSFFWSFYGFAWTHLTAILLMFFQLWLVDVVFVHRKKAKSR